MDELNEKKLDLEQLGDVAGGYIDHSIWRTSWTGTCPFCNRYAILYGDYCGHVKCGKCGTEWNG